MKALFFTRVGPGVREVEDDYGQLPFGLIMADDRPGPIITQVVPGTLIETAAWFPLRRFRRAAYYLDDPDQVRAWRAWGRLEVAPFAYPRRGLIMEVFVEEDPAAS